jgi:hypothetical protein
MHEDQVAEICRRMAQGESFRSACRAIEVSESTARYWFMTNADAFAHSTRARELGCDALADECLEIADGNDPADVKRVRIDTRIRLIGKWSQRYSDKVTVKSESTVTHKYDLDSLEADKLEQLERILADAERGSGGAGEAVASSVH